MFIHRTSDFQEWITDVKAGSGVAVYLYKKQHSSLCLLHIYDPVIQNSSTAVIRHLIFNYRNHLINAFVLKANHSQRTAEGHRVKPPEIVATRMPSNWGHFNFHHFLTALLIWFHHERVNIYTESHCTDFTSSPDGRASSCSPPGLGSLSVFLSNMALCRAVINFGSFGLIFFSSSSTCKAKSLFYIPVILKKIKNEILILLQFDNTANSCNY